IAMAIYAPSMTNDRIAGFSKSVTKAARRGDAVAREIIAEAGRELGTLAVAVIGKLGMEREIFQVAHVGGVFTAGDLVLDTLREAMARAAPKAFLAPPLLSPVIAATRIAHARFQRRLALAV
ncbi:MAG: hypothetical protein H0W99_06870, partial [Acidobacteria bacterium]|nr:hypothetical protein [Acidobacteriota bacterium]